MRPFLIALFGFLPVLPAGASSFSSSAVGTTTANFLKLGVGARAEGMGEAYSSVADEASALYWNPAALTRVPNRSATLMHAAYIDSSYFDYASFVQNLGPLGAWGAGAQFMSAGSITQTDQTGVDVGSFAPNDLAVSVGYAYKFEGREFMTDLNGMSFGITGKYIQSKIINTARTGVVDLGILTPAYLEDRLRVAITATNLGGKLKFDQQYAALPMAFRIGASYALLPRWLASVDAGFPKDNIPYIGAGTEYIWGVTESVKLAGRAGYNTRTLGGVDGFSGASLGFGMLLAKFDVDYAFVPFGSLGQTHRLSLTFNF